MLERGEPDPPLANKPELEPDLVPIWSAFLELHQTRRTGWVGAEPLNPREIVAFLREVHGLTDRETLAFWYWLIRSLDDEFLEYQEEKRKAEEQNRPKRR